MTSPVLWQGERIQANILGLCGSAACDSEHVWRVAAFNADILGLCGSAACDSEHIWRVAASNCTQVVVPVAKFAQFFRIHHADVTFAMFEATRFFANLLQQVEANSSTDLVPLIWEALRQGRVLDLETGLTVLRLAREPPPAIPTDPVAIAFHGQQLQQRLVEIAKTSRVADATIQQFGPLGLGLDVAATVAMELTRRQGLRFKTDARQQLMSNCEAQAQKLIKDLSKLDRALSRVLGRVKNRPLDILESNTEMTEWVARQRASIRDRRGFPLALFLNDEKDGLSGEVETWPEWAQAVPLLPQWAALRRICLLWRDLGEARDEVCFPRYQMLPRLSCLSCDLLALPRQDVMEVLEPRERSIFLRVSFPGLAARVLAQAMHEEGLQGQLAECLAAGSDPVTVLADDWKTHGLTSNSKQDDYRLAEAYLEMVPAGVWADGLDDLTSVIADTSRQRATASRLERMVEVFPELKCFLRPRTFEQMESYLNCVAGTIANRFPMSTPKDIADRFTEPSLPHRPNERFNLRTVLDHENSERSNYIGRLLKRVNGRKLYRILTDEESRSPVGNVRRGMIWPAARYELLRGRKEEVFKQVVVDVTSRGYPIIAIESSAIIIEAPFDSKIHPSQICDLALSIALKVLPDTNPNWKIGFSNPELL